MITCQFEKGHKTSLRHVVTHAICSTENQILLVKRNPDLLEGGKWALPGGFLDRNESIYQGVLRELLEETGWVGEIMYLFRINSNPNRPAEDRQNVAFDFIVKPVKRIAESDKESSIVEWVDISQINNAELAFDHGESLDLYLKYRSKKFSLPVIT